MAWNPSGLNPIEVTVDGRIDGQQIVNKFWMTSNTPGAGVTDGALLALNWRDNYRTNILTNLYTWYTVFRYTFREIVGAVLSDPGPPPRYRSLYSITGIAVVAGNPATDHGTIPLAGGASRLPAHEALRVFKEPALRTLKFFKGNYSRFAGFTTSEKSPTAEIWSAAQLTAFDINFRLFNLLNMPGSVGGLPTWSHALWSPAYFATLIPAPQTITATQKVISYVSDPYVGTQVSRRYSPAGSFKGR